MAGVPDLTRKLQTGTMTIECLIWLSGTQGVMQEFRMSSYMVITKISSSLVDYLHQIYGYVNMILMV